MRRTLLVAAVPAIVTAAAWLRCERPQHELWRAALIVVVALVAGAFRPFPVRLAAGSLGALGAIWLAFRLSPLDGRGFLGPLGTRFRGGFLDFYDVRLPFDPLLHPDMSAVVLVALFLFVLLGTTAVAARRPLPAMLALLVGAGWPATLVGSARALVVGAAILLGLLVVLGGLAGRRVPVVAVPAAAALALVAVGVASSSAVAKEGLVRWETWNPLTAPDRAVSVAFAWDAGYGGITFPARATTVLEVRASPTQSLYWRAAVLDDFGASGWTAAVPRPGDGLEPPAARDRANLTKQVVTVKALADTRLVGGSAPVAFDAGGADLVQPAPGFAFLPGGLSRGFRYTVWSYAPQPTPAQLRRSAPVYPRELTGPNEFLDVWPGVTMPPFGSRNRPVAVAATLATHPEVSRYRPLAEVARRVAGGAPTPYAAAVTLESWFRSRGGFVYADDPPFDPAAPLVSFVTRTRAGYCQYFAGAMALMLRYLGVPARVAVGFSSGTYDARRGVWIVTDRDAHAWVEAWFRGYGWLPFDPTPGAGRPEQGTLSARYSATSRGFDLAAALTGAPAPPGQQASRHRELPAGPGLQAAGAGTVAPPAVPTSPDRLRFAWLALLVGAASVALLAVAKLAARRSRFLTRDPRATASACRRELEDFLLDQRIEPARGATLRELGELLRRELAVDPDAFVAAATAARFGPPAEAAVAARDARRELETLLRSMRRHLSARERLRGLLSLRTLRTDRTVLDVSA